ncbi:MAG: hypothetical protein HYU39_04725 [Thaumarchaeota archaeon]|nr:hypothetical protein [Nitrososphaerota archaeon]
MRELEARPENIESRVEKIERELLVIKLALKKQKTKKIKLNKLVNEISSKAKPLETTSLIREMRNRAYG